ncbi:MAG: PhoH family protein [candidate division TM6 bacterium GW2011_GWE2_41_16]|nr:MAG: PhoH family protein [candidate division TM6 bacterium GW2011_GWE2_41_16]
MVEQKRKVFVLDTNVLVHDPHAIFNFGDNIVGIPLVVLQELDHFKGENTPRGKSTRQAIRVLDGLRESGSLRDGVVLDSGGIVRILISKEHDWQASSHDPIQSDNEILESALSLKKEGYSVRLISKDINMRVRADALGLEVEDYARHVITEEFVYKGWQYIAVPAVSLRRGIPDELIQGALEKRFMLNEYLLVHSEHNDQNFRVFRYKGGKEFIEVNQPGFTWPIEARNVQQLMAFDALLDPSIQFVTLVGGAGTGKTFLALVAGLYETLIKNMYERLLISRPVIPLGPDIGYLPGDVQEKMHSWMQPIYDNMDFIVHLANKGLDVQRHEDHHDDQHGQQGQADGGKKHKKGKKGQVDGQQRAALAPLDVLVKRGKISLEAITYMRGRSIPYQYILIDEVQNLTPHEVKTLITRVGEGSKIVLAGDPYQIDSPYLDFSSNGLVVASEKFKGEPYFSTIFLQSSERSMLSQRASELL